MGGGSCALFNFAAAPHKQLIWIFAQMAKSYLLKPLTQSKKEHVHVVT